MSLEPFAAGGQVGADLAAVDWATTPLGPPESWPVALTSVVRAMLSSRFSMWMCWGEELTFFCNDAYRRDTLGKKYPWALGRSTREVWSEIWSDIGPRIEAVMGEGLATWDEALLLFLERSGYREETYHTFSYSPLASDDGTIAGLLCVVSEDTERVISAQRLAALRDLAAATSSLTSEAAVVAAACRALESHPRPVPFALLYVADSDGVQSLAGTAGIPRGHPVAAEVIDGSSPFPLVDGGPVVVDLLPDRFPDLPPRPFDAPPQQAVVMPLQQPGQESAYGTLVVGLNRFRPYDEGYQSFLELVAGQLGSSLAGARAYEEERERAERLAELDRAKTTFFTNISHEFRTPLTLLLGPTEDALADTDEPLPERQRERLEIVRRNGHRLLRLVNNLLDFSRIEAGRTTPRVVPTDLRVLTEELAGLFRPATERAGLTLDVVCDDLGEAAWVDPEMWSKIVLNLLSNALKFTFNGGITARLGRDGGRATLEVSDTGIGIDPTEQQHLFERFRRVTGARSRTHEGSGIGLALVAELSRLHGGEASAQSAPGEGSTFRVSIPLGSSHLAEVADVGPAEPDAQTASREAARVAVGFLSEAMRWEVDGQATGELTTGEDDERPTILVVDDNADMRDYITRLLATTYHVRTADDGVAALESIAERRPDLVVTDVMMPRLDGFGLLRSIRADSSLGDLPVVMVSARAGDEATVEGLEAGADDYLVKPFGARELMARVGANLELERARRTQDALARSQSLLDQAQRLAGVGSWEYDLQTGRFTASDELVRQMRVEREVFESMGLDQILAGLVHPDDRQTVAEAFAAAAQGAPMDYTVRLLWDDGEERWFHTLGLAEADEHGRPVRLRGSNQDVTEQRNAERVIAEAAAQREALAREHQIADELQASLLPAMTFTPEHLQVATFYRAGVEGTQVGGDWYDVIELGAGRTALVMGDVMGRGVRAAAVMGQLRSAVRAYARLDLRPADLLDYLDGVVRDLGSDQIVTCVYAVFDPADRSLLWANAGHLPPLLRRPDGSVTSLTEGSGPPLGAGLPAAHGALVTLEPGATLLLYTDGLVESRDRDIEVGIDQLAAAVAALDDLDPGRLVDDLLPHGPEDDVAVLMASLVDPGAPTLLTLPIEDDQRAVQGTREQVGAALDGWGVPKSVAEDVVLLASELVTNAIVHGRPPAELRLRHSPRHVVLEVSDAAPLLPRPLRAGADDEHGRGLLLVAALADRWGTRPTAEGKAVWCVISLP